jgi:hypothetical protein
MLIQQKETDGNGKFYVEAIFDKRPEFRDVLL